MHFVSYSAMLSLVTLSTHLIMVIVIAAVIEWLLGALWYGLIFRKSWMAWPAFPRPINPRTAP